MYIISKFESFSNQPDIEEIKDIFQELVDKWNMVFGGRFFFKLGRAMRRNNNLRDSNCIGYDFFIEEEDISSYHRLIAIGKEIKNINEVYLIIHMDLFKVFYKDLYEFNNDCEDLLKRFQSEFNCELLTAYGNPYLQSKGIPTSRFLFVFRRDLKLESFSKKKNLLGILPTYKKLSNSEIESLNAEYLILIDILQEIFDDFNIYKMTDSDFNPNYIESSEDEEYSVWFFEYGPGHKKARGCDVPNFNDASLDINRPYIPEIQSIRIKSIPYTYGENLNQIINSDVKQRIEILSGRRLLVDTQHLLDNYIDFSISLSRSID
jgi:hypothetical protein